MKKELAAEERLLAEKALEEEIRANKAEEALREKEIAANKVAKQQSKSK